MKQILLKVYPNGVTSILSEKFTFDRENNTAEIVVDYSAVEYLAWIKQLDLTFSDGTHTFIEGSGNTLTVPLLESYLKQGSMTVQPIAKRLVGETYEKIKWQIVLFTVNESLNVLEDDTSITPSVAEQWEIRINLVEQEELTRQSNESTRNNQEDTRQSNESGRVNAENIRVTSENARALFVAYNSATSYVVGNKVSYLGSSYQCILASLGNLPTNTTYWLLIASKGDDYKLNVVSLGIDNTGSLNVGNLINAIIQNNNYATLYFPDGIYNIEQTLLINNYCSLELSTNATLKCVAAIDKLININRTTEKIKQHITGGVIDGNGLANNCIYVTYCANFQIYNIVIKNAILFNVNFYGGYELYLEDAHIDNDLVYSVNPNLTGINARCTDSVFKSIVIKNNTKGLINEEVSNEFFNIHIWGNKLDRLSNTYGLVANEETHMQFFYADTCAIGVQTNNYAKVFLHSPQFIFSNTYLIQLPSLTPNFIENTTGYVYIYQGRMSSYGVDIIIATYMNRIFLYNCSFSSPFNTSDTFTNITTDLFNELINGKVDKTTKVNDKQLSSDVTISSSDVPNTPSGNILSITAQDAINELDTKKANKIQPSWTNLTLLNGWVVAPSSANNIPQYYIDEFNIIHFRGRIANGVSNTTAFIMETGKRIAAGKEMSFIGGTRSVVVNRLDVYASGEVRPVITVITDYWIDLSCISYRVEI